MARRGVSWALGRQSLHTHCWTHKQRRPPWVSWPHEVGPSRSLQLCQDEIVLWRYLNPIKSHHQSIQPVFQYRKKAYQVGIGWKKHTSIKVSYCWYSQNTVQSYVMTLLSWSYMRQNYHTRLYLTRRIQWWHFWNPRMRLYHPHFGLIWGGLKFHQKETW